MADRIYSADHYLNARRLYSEGRYFEASIGFERAIFYATDSTRMEYYRYCKSLCYKELSDYTRAIRELNTIKTRLVPDSLFIMVLYEKAFCSFMIDDFGTVLRAAEEITSLIPDTAVLVKIEPLKILSLNSLWRFDEAFSQWNYLTDRSYLPDSEKETIRQQVRDLYKPENLPVSLSPLKAQRLSGLLPGSGQVYCKALGEGSLNLLINASLIAFTISELVAEYYFSGYFVGVRLFNKFYSGGIRRSGLIAGEKNLEAIRKFNAKNTDLLMRLDYHKNVGNR